jgi:hypothetical protein
MLCHTPQAAARAEAAASAARAVAFAARRNATLDSRVSGAAARAAGAVVRAVVGGGGAGAARQAQQAQAGVERVIRGASQARQQLAETVEQRVQVGPTPAAAQRGSWVGHARPACSPPSPLLPSTSAGRHPPTPCPCRQGALDRQARKEGRADQQVGDAQARLDRVAAGVEQLLGRNGHPLVTPPAGGGGDAAVPPRGPARELKQLRALVPGFLRRAPPPAPALTLVPAPPGPEPAAAVLEAGPAPGGSGPIAGVGALMQSKAASMQSLADAASTAIAQNSGAEASVARSLGDAASVMLVRNTGAVVGAETSVARSLGDAASVALVHNSGAIVGAESRAIRAVADAASVALVQGSGILSRAAGQAIQQAPHVVAQIPGQVASGVASAVAQVPGQVVSGVLGAVVSQIPVVGTISSAMGTVNNALGTFNNALYVANTGLNVAGKLGEGAAYLIGQGMEAHRAYIAGQSGQPQVLPLTSMSHEQRMAVLERIAADAINGGEAYSDGLPTPGVAPRGGAGAAASAAASAGAAPGGAAYAGRRR